MCDTRGGCLEQADRLAAALGAHPWHIPDGGKEGQHRASRAGSLAYAKGAWGLRSKPSSGMTSGNSMSLRDLYTGAGAQARQAASGSASGALPLPFPPPPPPPRGDSPPTDMQWFPQSWVSRYEGDQVASLQQSHKWQHALGIAKQDAHVQVETDANPGVFPIPGSVRYEH